MRILQVCFNRVPRYPARNGGELRFWQNAASLAELGHEVFLAVLEPPESVPADVRPFYQEITEIPCRTVPAGRIHSWLSPVRPASALALFAQRDARASGQLRKWADHIQADVIWADGFAALFHVSWNRPVIYAVHDFLSRVKKVRLKTAGASPRWLDVRRLDQSERAEIELCRRCVHTMCVSASEAAGLGAMGIPTTYIPIVGPDLAAPSIDLADPMRIFLFGTGACTALRSAIHHLRTEVWPLLAGRPVPFEWHRVGAADPKPSPEQAWLRTNFQEHGFVPDLGAVFHPGDVALMPYTEDTGFRTKFVTAAAHGVINVGYEISFACAPEFQHERDCLVARDPADLVATLTRLANDPALRRQLASNARNLYEREFSFGAQLPKYESVLRASLDKASTRGSRPRLQAGHKQLTAGGMG